MDHEAVYEVESSPRSGFEGGTKLTFTLDFRYNTRAKLGVNDTERAARAVVGAQGKRLTYQSTRQQEALDTPPF